MIISCRLLGHRFAFSAAGPIMRWQCRGCGAGGSKAYASSADATRYATAFGDSEPGRTRIAPPLGLFPLRLWRWWRSRRHRTAAESAS